MGIINMKINNLGTTMLVVTHAQNLVEQFGNRTIVINDGVIVSDGMDGYNGMDGFVNYENQ